MAVVGVLILTFVYGRWVLGRVTHVERYEPIDTKTQISSRIQSCINRLDKLDKFKGKRKIRGKLEDIKSVLDMMSQEDVYKMLHHTNARQTMNSHLPSVLSLVENLCQDPYKYGAHSISEMVETLNTLEKILKDYMNEVSETYRAHVKNELNIIDTMLNKNGHTPKDEFFIPNLMNKIKHNKYFGKKKE